MSLSNIKDIRSMSGEEISQEILKTKRELLELRMQKATRQATKPHLFKHAKLKLVHLLTVEHEKQNK
uniref:ribosomal protein L29 n=1 Tax=Porphyridium aerugineum TaxID=2792 RepID=UPI001FCDF514|nr:ribosomal protein L29 [Porphyridium aerugineum]UNJ17883.1 ribosomal protein L29 [Porphyridium aerugineum]